jgi:hypothetical protein
LFGVASALECDLSDGSGFVDNVAISNQRSADVVEEVYSDYKIDYWKDIHPFLCIAEDRVVPDKEKGTQPFNSYNPDDLIGIGKSVNQACAYGTSATACTPGFYQNAGIGSLAPCLPGFYCPRDQVCLVACSSKGAFCPAYLEDTRPIHGFKDDKNDLTRNLRFNCNPENLFLNGYPLLESKEKEMEKCCDFYAGKVDEEDEEDTPVWDSRGCEGWKATSGCDPTGTLDPLNDLSCGANIPNRSGFCVCAGGEKRLLKGCETTNLYANCSQACVDEQPKPVGTMCSGAYNQTLCPVGYYCPDSVTQIVCPGGHFCDKGSQTPTRCGPLTICSEGTDSPVVLLGYVVFAIFIVVFVGVRRYIGRKRAQNRTQRELGGSKLAESDLGDLGASTPRMKKRGSVIVENQIKKKEFTINIQFENLGLELKSVPGKKVLNGVTGELHAGRVTAVMGPSGAGKTTFLNTIADRATYGECR